MYVAKMYGEMQNQYVVISVTIGCTSSAMASASKYEELCLEDNDESFFCIKCFNNELPFGLESDKSLV
jgi:hypothetical protein